MAIWTSKNPGWFIKFPAEDRPSPISEGGGGNSIGGEKGLRLMMPPTCSQDASLLLRLFSLISLVLVKYLTNVE